MAFVTSPDAPAPKLPVTSVRTILAGVVRVYDLVVEPNILLSRQEIKQPHDSSPVHQHERVR